MSKITVNTSKTVNNTPKKLPAQRIVSKTPLSGNQKYLPNSLTATTGDSLLVR